MYALTEDQIDQVSGAINWAEVAMGVTIISCGIAFTVATGGMGGVALSVIAGAGTAGEIMVAATAIGLSAIGGYVAGGAFTN